MIETVFAQLRLAASMAFGLPVPARSLDRLIAALQATRQEFGSVGAEGAELINGPTLDEETRREVQFRHFRRQAVRAARETAYYGAVFKQLDLDPARLRYEDISRLPVTPKEDLRADPDAFVRRTARPYLRAMTTGTTGKPTSVYFSAVELKSYAALTALSALVSGDILAEDIVQISTSSKGTLGNLSLAGACGHIGAIVYLAGLIEPTLALQMLSEKRHLPGKKGRTSILYSYPSYLGALVEDGLKRGYGPTDFGLEQIIIGGEIVTEGLRRRAQQLFGPVKIVEGYGITELWPFGGRFCPQGHLHFEVSHGLLEVVSLDSGQPARPGQPGTIVGTPFAPHRETSLVLRYDTEDVVQALETPLTCQLKSLPAVSQVLGKRRLAVQHDEGWTWPRQVMEALEAVEEVPLPARCSFWAAPGGVALEVVVRQADPAVRRKLEQSLGEHGVPVRELRLVEDPARLRQALPLRGDLREHSFDNQANRLMQGAY